jgi:lipopolysaccharide/colanic/teichoic acid biosynthesis glycosyltransferase
MNPEWKVSLDDSQMGRRSASTPQAYLRIKRALDILMVSIGLILLSPIFMLVALIIKLEEPKGSVFFYQMRIGKDGIPFRMYKFRSMVSNAEDMLTELVGKNEIEGLMFKMKDDPRITRIGKFIRRTSIDELPQLFNVFIGDMSLVGPRPPLHREVKHYSPYHMQRLKVTPGCTGLWQVSGRNSLNFEQMIELDLKYISERNLFLDIKIIMKTFRTLAGAKDAF